MASASLTHRRKRPLLALAAGRSAVTGYRLPAKFPDDLDVVAVLFCKQRPARFCKFLTGAVHADAQAAILKVGSAAVMRHFVHIVHVERPGLREAIT